MKGFLIISIAALLWLRFLVKVDENRRYKRLGVEVVIFFVFGFIFAVTAYFAEYFMEMLLSAWDLNFSISGLAFEWLLVGFVEEGIKFSTMFIVLSARKNIWEPKDIIIFSGAVGLGFATMENIFYNVWYGRSVLTFARSFLTVMGHIAYCVLWGVGLVIYLYNFYSKKTARLLLLSGFVVASFAHGFYDFSLVFMKLPVWVNFLWSSMVVISAILVFGLIMNESPYRKFELEEADKFVWKIEKTLMVNPANYVLNRRIAIFYLYKGMFKKSLVAFRRCLKQQPKDLYSKFYILLLDYITDVENQSKFNRLFSMASYINSYNHKLLMRLQREVIKVLRKSPAISEKIVNRVLPVFLHFEPGNIMYGLYSNPTVREHV